MAAGCRQSEKRSTDCRKSWHYFLLRIIIIINFIQNLKWVQINLKLRNKFWYYNCCWTDIYFYLETTYTWPSDPKLSGACTMVIRQLIHILKYVLNIDKFHPHTEQILMLITLIFVLGGNHFWLAVRVSNH